MLNDERSRLRQKIEIQRETIAGLRIEYGNRLAEIRALREHMERAITTIAGMDCVLSALAAENNELRKLAEAPPKDGHALAN